MVCSDIGLINIQYLQETITRVIIKCLRHSQACCCYWELQANQYYELLMSIDMKQYWVSDSNTLNTQYPTIVPLQISLGPQPFHFTTKRGLRQFCDILKISCICNEISSGEIQRFTIYPNFLFATVLVFCNVCSSYP